VARLRALRLSWLLAAVETALATRRHWQRIEPGTRRRLRELVIKSRGNPSNLTPHERRELRRLAGQLDLRTLVRELGDVVSPLPLPGRRRRRRRRG
jgi:hypothetical protein